MRRLLRLTNIKQTPNMNASTGETKTIGSITYEIHIINDRNLNINLPDTNIHVDGDMAVSNITCKNLYVNGDVNVYGDQHVYGNQYVYGDQDVRGDQYVRGNQYVDSHKDVRGTKKINTKPIINIFI